MEVSREDSNSVSGGVRLEEQLDAKSGLTVFKLINCDPNDVRLEEISAEEAEEGASHLGTHFVEDGGVIHLRAVTTSESENGDRHVVVRSVPITSEYQDGETEEAKTDERKALSLENAVVVEEGLQVEGVEEGFEARLDLNEMKLYQHDGAELGLVEGVGGQVILHRTEGEGEERTQYIQIFTADEEEGNPVEINLDQLDPLMRQNFYDSPASPIEGSLIFTQEEIGQTTEIEVTVKAKEVPVKAKKKEPSTAAALDLGCEWSLMLPFGFQGKTLDDRCQKLILNVWHYFKHLKKYPELIRDKNAQGLAGDALNIGTKTIGRIGKLYRKGIDIRVGSDKSHRHKKRRNPLAVDLLC